MRTMKHLRGLLPPTDSRRHLARRRAQLLFDRLESRELLTVDYGLTGISMPGSINAPQTVEFSPQATGSMASSATYDWKLLQGGSQVDESGGATYSHTFYQPGTYEIDLTASLVDWSTFQTVTFTTSATVTVNSSSIDYTLSGISQSPSTIVVPEDFTLTAQTTGTDASAATYEWVITDNTGGTVSDTFGGSTLTTSESSAGTYGLTVIGTVSKFGATKTQTYSTTIVVAPYTIDYSLTGVSVSPSEIYVGDTFTATAQASGTDAASADYVWVITDSSGDVVETQDTGQTPALTTYLSIADDMTVSVTATVNVNGSQIQLAQAAPMSVNPYALSSISASNPTIHQWGIETYTATTIRPNAPTPAITWDYKRDGEPDTKYVQFGGGLTFDQTENLIGTFDIRATLTSGGKKSVKYTSVTVLPRPVVTWTYSYTTQWQADVQTDVWADIKLDIATPAVGERTSKPFADVTLTLTRGANATREDNWEEIENFSFSEAEQVGGTWSYAAVGMPLTAQDPATVPTPSIWSTSFYVPAGGGTNNFELDAELPPGWENPLPFIAGQDSKHYTLLKIDDTITATLAADGTYTAITVAPATWDQAKMLFGASQHLPIRTIDRP